MSNRETKVQHDSDSQTEIISVLSDFSQFHIILLLSERPIHGYGIIKKFEERTGKKLSTGTLYPFLQKLEETYKRLGKEMPEIKFKDSTKPGI